MATRGRKKQPVIDNTPQPNYGKPTCPKWLDPVAKAEWKRIVPMLDDMGILAKCDHTLVETYCTLYGRWVKAEQLLQREGMTIEATKSGFQVPRPEVGIANCCIREMRATMDLLGLTPKGRQKLVVPERPPEEQAKWQKVLKIAT